MNSILGFFQGAYPNLCRYFTRCKFIYELINPLHYVGEKKQNKTKNNLEDKSYCWLVNNITLWMKGDILLLLKKYSYSY